MKKFLFTLGACLCCLSMQAQLISGGQITTTTAYQYISDTADLQIITNVPTHLTLDDKSMGETQATPYRVKFGQHKVTLRAEGYYRKTKNVDVKRNMLNIYEFKMMRKPRPYAIRHGLQQELVLNYSGGDGDYGWSNSGLFDYVIGWRFNDWVFLGAGTGIHVYDGHFFDKSKATLSHANDKIYASKDDYCQPAHNRGAFAEIPLYAQLKVYCMNTRLKPYIMTSLGGRFGLNKFNDVGILFNIGPGAEFCITDKYAINLFFGYEMKGQKEDPHYSWSSYYSWSSQYSYYDGDNGCNTSGCPYHKNRESHYHYNAKNTYELMHGFCLRVGFVF